MPGQQTSRKYGRARSGPIAVLSIIVAVLAGSAAGGPASVGQQGSPVSNPPGSGSVSLQPVRAGQGLRDVAGAPMPFGTARAISARSPTTT